MVDKKKDWTPENLFMMLYGPDGTIPKFYKQTDSLCRKVDSLEGKVDSLYSKLDETMGALKKHNGVAKDLSDHIVFCDKHRSKQEVAVATESEVLGRISRAKDQAKKDAYNQFHGILKLILVILGIVGLFITVGGIFLW